MKSGFARVFTSAEFDEIPIADGGEGTLDALVNATGGRTIDCTVAGPAGEPVQAAYGVLSDGRTAVVELARASGLALVPQGRNDALAATTYGTGELISAAIDAGFRRIILALGGSATSDGGCGALSALGAKFLDASGTALPRGGAALAALKSIDTAELARKLAGVSIDVASDVQNPLCGPQGAAAVYGPQKGASPDQVRHLDAALANFGAVCASLNGTDMQAVPGAGAAGGTGGGFLALAGARLCPGADLVLDAIGFDRRLKGASLLVTGEGRLDRQTLAGKAPYAAALRARSLGVPVVAVAGSLHCSGDDLERLGLATACSIIPAPMPLPEAMSKAAQLTADAAERLALALQLQF